MAAAYPWQDSDRQRLLGLRSHLPHAVLLTGPKGVGKLALAKDWGKTLLCESPNMAGEACSSCEACHWFDAGTHPDWLHLSFEEKEGKDGDVRLATEITVDQARQATQFAQLSSFRGGRRIALIEPADALNRAASNALLKVLEEPPLNVVFILVSHQVRRLLPTLLSRCQRQDIGLPEPGLATDWLKSEGVEQAEVGWLLPVARHWRPWPGRNKKAGRSAWRFWMAWRPRKIWMQPPRGKAGGVSLPHCGMVCRTNG